MKRTVVWAACALASCALGCSAASPGEAEEVSSLAEAATTYTLSGSVMTADGLGISGVTVKITGKASKQVTTDANGTYSFTGLASGSYTVSTTKTNCSFTPTSKTLTLSANTVVGFVGSGTGCVVSATFNKKVYALIYNPNVTVNGVTKTLTQHLGWDDPDTLFANYISWMKTTSNNRLNYTIATRKLVSDWPVKTDGFKYDQNTYLNVCDYEHGTNCHDPDSADIPKMLTDNQICEALNAGTIDELWLMGGPYFGTPESSLAGPKGYDYNGPWFDATTCNKLMPIMGFSYKEGLPNMIHDFGHRTEATMSRVMGGWHEDSIANMWNRFGLVKAQSPSFNYAGCGSVHQPPNSAGAEYIYDIATPVNSFCDDFLGYPTVHTPSTVLKSTTCSAWGCTDIGYYRWWLQHLPKVAGFGPDDKLADWWRYAVDPNTVFLTDRNVCSSEYSGGWCQGVSDGTHGTCNNGEWATAGVSTGNVQVNFKSARTVSSVTIYDRACPERVLSGRLQLSDGTTFSFGALEDTGTTGTTLTFSSRSLTWVKVFIDSSDGGNPGIGEITVQ
ncbi:MAG: carboxypeptidase-like regulatory domain-containing protein [Polyangiaceae bacterium]